MDILLSFYLVNNISLMIYIVKGWRYMAGELYVHAEPMTWRAMAIRVRLRDLLERRGMAQTELQARTGLGYSTINALYHGKTERVAFATLDALCEVLDCGVGEILEHVSEKKRMRS